MKYLIVVDMQNDFTIGSLGSVLATSENSHFGIT